MKRILLFVVLLACNQVMAQQGSFNDIERSITDHMSKNRWDEVMIQAPDLIIEDPSRGEGYYYTAYAFYKMGQPDKALKYLSTADGLADESLKKKISVLNDYLQQSRQNVSDLDKVKILEEQGQKSQAAELWRKLWQSEKSNLDYALNAVDDFISLKKYPEALEILNDPSMKHDEGAIKLITMINRTPQMTKLNTYIDAMKTGREAYSQDNFQLAISKFESALKNKPNDPDATNLKTKAEDELAWQKAKKANSITSYEEYIAGYTIKSHKDEAEEIVKKALIYYGEKYANENDVTQMESYLKKYLAKYPYGEDAGKANQIMCNVYKRNAEAKALIKTEYDQREAINFYNKAKQVCVNTTQFDKSIRKAQRLQTRFGRPDRWYYAITYDSISTIGFSMGSLNNPGLGGYMTVRGNSHILTSATYFTVDNTGKTDGNVFDDIRYTNIERRANFELVGGITKKITYPLWMYFGAGISYNPVFWEMDTYDDDGDYYDTDWVKNTDETNLKPSIETGLIMDLKGFNLRAGIKTQNFSGLLFTFGIGFSNER